MGEEHRSRERFVAGDPLRGIAALGVVYGHTFAYALIATGLMLAGIELFPMRATMLRRPIVAFTVATR